MFIFLGKYINKKDNFYFKCSYSWENTLGTWSSYENGNDWLKRVVFEMKIQSLMSLSQIITVSILTIPTSLKSYKMTRGTFSPFLLLYFRRYTSLLLLSQKITAWSPFLPDIMTRRTFSSFLLLYFRSISFWYHSIFMLVKRHISKGILIKIERAILIEVTL